MQDDPRILIELIERNLSQIKTDVTALANHVAVNPPAARKGRPAMAKPIAIRNSRELPPIEEDPNPVRKAKRLRMKVKALEKWAKIKAGKANPPKKSRQR